MYLTIRTKRLFFHEWTLLTSLFCIIRKFLTVRTHLPFLSFFFRMFFSAIQPDHLFHDILFFLPFLFFLSAYFAGGDDKGSLFPGQGEKGGGNEVQFLQAIVGDVCLLIALSYQFFASSTSSCRGTSKPQTSCTFCRYSAYSPEVSMVLSRFSAPMTL